jgi:hypothetical protein
MVTPKETSPQLLAFSDRLNELLDARGFAKKGKGRQIKLAEKYELNQKGVRKWVEAEGLPEVTRMIQIALDFGCHFEWLATGRGPRDLAVGETHPHQKLLDRLRTSDAATVALVELALSKDSEQAAKALSPSIKMMVETVKRAIQMEQTKTN